MKNYDLVVVGSGAGLMVLEAALEQGMSCAIVEKDKFGGTCLTKGCIPSKMLVYPADLIREAQAAKRVGLDFSPPAVDWTRISDRMWEQISHNESIEKRLRETDGLTVYKGIGKFIDKNTMRVTYNDGGTSDIFTAKRYILAAGARTNVPNIDGLSATGFVTSESFFGDKFPNTPWKSLLIVGGGPISAEFAHIFSAVGTKVTVLQSGERLLNAEEEEVSEFVKTQFENNGISVITNASVRSAGRSGQEKTLVYMDKVTEKENLVSGEEIFIATGVRSNGDSLNLEQAGVDVDPRGYIVTNDYLETSQNNIWAIGDINGKYQFRHKANYEASILIHNMISAAEEKKPLATKPFHGRSIRIHRSHMSG